MNKLAKHFGLHPGTVISIIKFGEHYTFDDLPGRGRKPGPVDPNLNRNVVNLINRNKSMTIRNLAKKAGTTV